MAFTDFILTNAGKTLMNKVAAGTTTLTLSSFRVGSGALTADAIPSMTALVNEKAKFGFSSIKNLSDGSGVQLSVVVSNVGNTADYTMTEAAIYATDPDSGDILFAAAYDTSGDYKIVKYTSGYPVTITEDIVLAFGSTNTVSVTIDGSSIVTTSSLQTMVDNMIDGKLDKSAYVVDSTVNSTSTNPVSGKGVAAYVTNGVAADLSTLTTKVVGKADKATTIAGYGITDAYTQVQTDNLLKDKADKASTVNATLSASGWSNSQYSFESSYPESSYDVEVGIDGDKATDAQYKAWAALKPMDSLSNILKIKGKTPVIDIPVILKVVKK